MVDVENSTRWGNWPQNHPHCWINKNMSIIVVYFNVFCHIKIIECFHFEIDVWIEKPFSKKYWQFEFEKRFQFALIVFKIKILCQNSNYNCLIHKNVSLVDFFGYFVSSGVNLSSSSQEIVSILMTQLSLSFVVLVPFSLSVGKVPPFSVHELLWVAKTSLYYHLVLLLL